MSIDRNSIKGPIRQFIAEYGRGKGITGIADDESLLKRNVFDSLGTFRLIAFVEEAFPLTVDEADIAPENFETINLIEAFVMRKVGIEEPATPTVAAQQGELAAA
jgi:acyl carrier protein